MFHPATDTTQSPRRLRYTEAILVLAILAFGGFTLMSEGRLSVGNFIAGVNETLSR